MVKDFGYTLSKKHLNLPRFQGELDRIEQTKERINEILPYVSLASEISRREFLISPVILDFIHYRKCTVRSEYQIYINDKLQGYLDYFITNNTNSFIIESVEENLDYGMTQLCAELIALDNWENTEPQEIILGAVTTGNIWQFCQLNRAKKHIEQGLNLYRVPEDIDTLMRILVQSLI